MSDSTDNERQTDKQIKVTDKRMFTQDGELRAEYKDIGRTSDASSGPSPAGSEPPSGAAPATGPSGSPGPVGPSRPPSRSTGAGSGEPIVAPDGSKASAPEAKGGKPKDYPSGARFEELIALLAQTTATFLQQATRPEGRSENLDQAQLYFDLLEILADKTAGNLNAREQSMMDDALRQLRLAMAQHG